MDDNDGIIWFEVSDIPLVQRFEALVPVLIACVGGIAGVVVVMVVGLGTVMDSGLAVPFALSLVGITVLMELAIFFGRRWAHRHSIRRVGLDQGAIYLDRPIGVARIPRAEVASMDRVRWSGFQLRTRSRDFYWIPEVMPQDLRRRLIEWPQDQQ